MHMFFGGLVGMLALSCAGSADVPPRGSSDQDTVTATAPDSLRISLDLPREVRVGQPVPIAIRVKNETERPIDLYLRGRAIAFDIFVTRTDSRVVWQRLKDEIIPAIVQVKVLKPGEVLELRHEWNQRDNRGAPLGSGSYVVRGTVLTDGPALLETAAASLRIVPG